MYGYYRSLWKASYKKLRFYFVALIAFISFVILGLNLFFNNSLNIDVGFDTIKTIVYSAAVPILFTSFFVLLWYLFYKNIYDNSIGSNIEILSFTSGLTRTKIFFAKLLIYLTLSTILAFVFTLVFFVVSLSIYPISSGKIWLATLGHFAIAIIGSIFYFVLMFFFDMLMNKPRKKVTLAVIPIYSTFVLYGIMPTVNIILKSTFLDDKKYQEGHSNFRNTHFLNKDFSNSDLISISDSSIYKDWEDSTLKDKDLDAYQKYTNNLKAIHFFNDYFNFSEIVKAAIGIDKGLYDREIRYNFYKELPSDLTQNFYSIKLNDENQLKTFYFKSLIWNYQNENLSSSKRKEAQKNIEDKINELVNSLKNNQEFQKENPEWIEIINFLGPEIIRKFSINDEINYIDNLADTNIRWIAIYVYLKASENTSKNLRLSRLLPETETSSENQEYGYNLHEQEEIRAFYEYFVDANKIFAYRSPISNSEYSWISWIFIFVVIGGVGYWTIIKYKNKDVA